jgi:hypothetical protein
MVFTGRSLKELGLEQDVTATFARTYLNDNWIYIRVSERARADLRINDNRSGSKGVGVIDRRVPRPSQTIRHARAVGVTNTADAYLWLANLGDIAADFQLRSFGDGHPGMHAVFEWDQKNVTGAVRTGRFAPNVGGGDSVIVHYRLKTRGPSAGELRAGDIDEVIRFRMSGAGTVDNVAMVINYVEETQLSRPLSPRGVRLSDE